MGFDRRKLFPEPPRSDDTRVCPDYCESTLKDDGVCLQPCLSQCPLMCINPDYPWPPPPPPPLSGQSSQTPQISPFVIILIAVLGSAFLLVTYYAIIVKYCSHWTTSRRRIPPPQSNDTHEDFLDEDHGPVIDHPIWLINTVGLQQSIIDSITVCKYKRGEGLIEGTDCSVCLSEFREDETLRLLPKCSHAFHIPCIDTWLRSHKNCPLCRAPIVSNADVRPVTSPESNFNGSSSSREDTQMENFEIGNGGLIGDQRGENGVGAEIEDEISKGGLASPVVNSMNPVIGDLADDEIQPMRRSVSMDWRLELGNYLAEEPEGSSNTQLELEQVKESGLGIVPKSSNGDPSAFKLMASVKRSLSCGGKLFLSRYS